MMNRTPRNGRHLMAALATALAGANLAIAGGPCAPNWSNAGATLVPSTIPTPTVLALREFDPDGPGPLMRELYIGGGFSFDGIPDAANIARWDGFGWSDLGVNFQSGLPNNIQSEIRFMTVARDVTSAPDRQGLYVLGGFSSVGGVSSKFIAMWNGQTWIGFPGLNFSNVGWAAAIHDFDGDGPQPPRLVIGGVFGTPAAQLAPGFHWWDGAAWNPLGGPSRCVFRGMTSFDPDGAGPLPPRLIAAQLDRGIVEWNGTDWQLMLADTALSTVDFASLDPDGAGPLPPTLFMARINAPLVSMTGASPWTTESITARTLTVYDPDGAGPQSPMLYATGIVSAQSKVWMRVNGAWQEYTAASCPAGAPYALAWLDEDGAGPREPGLFVGGEFPNFAGMSVGGLAHFGCAFAIPRCYGDADGSGNVEFNDVSLVLARWGSRDQPGDIDRDGVVGMNDIVAVLASWGSACEDAVRPLSAEESWRSRGIADFNGDGAVNMDDEIWAIANAGLDPRSPYGRADQEQPLEAAVGRTPH